jgi:hypothetical protein
MASFYEDASLVLIPSGYKTSKIYAEKPTSGAGDLTFTRASGATRVGPNGLIEEVRTNLILQSQTFDNASWAKTTDGQVTITANAAVAPDGTTTADKMIPSAIAGFHCVQQAVSISASEVSVSIFAKAAESSFLQIFDSLTNEFANFNLTTGVVGSTNTYVASIESVGNGWYRCRATKAAPSGSFTLRYGVVTSASAVRGESFTGNGTNGLLIWGAQLEYGVATDYIPTTTAAVSVGPVSNVPRLDYLGSSCPRLLLEPQRTNLVTFSEQLNNAAWIKFQSSITANNAVSPDGYTSADKLIADATSNMHGFFQSLTPAAGVYTQSAFFKAGEYNFACLRLATDSDTKRYAVVLNLTTGVITATNSFGSPTSTSSKVENYGNGWYRLSISSAHTSGTMFPTFAVSSTAVPTFSSSLPLFTGDATSGIFAYGCQLELGAYPTSYVPTLSASVTRVVDDATKTGISSLIGQTEGTLFLDFEGGANDSANHFLGLSDGTTGNRIVIVRSSTNTLYTLIRVGGVDQALIQTGTLTANTRYKCAVAYKLNDIAFYVNGVLVGTDTAATIPATSVFATNTGVSSSYFERAINQALLFKTRLTNAQLAELTTL